jgi:hypothetical protein
VNHIEQFIISNDVRIDILIPDLKEKFNYFYPVSSALNQFDEVFVNLVLHAQKIELTAETIGFIIDRLKNRLVSNLRGENELPKNIKNGSLGWYYNVDVYKQWSNPDNIHTDVAEYAHFWLFSSKTVQAWIYTINHTIHFEISPSYPLIYSSIAIPNDNDFQIFMAKYKPILASEISHATAQIWIEKCDALLAQL